MLAVGLVFGSPAVAQEGGEGAGGGDGWTRDYTCHNNEEEHWVDEGIFDWSANTHNRWPGDCGVHNAPA